MTTAPRSPDTEGQADPGASAGTPRWVKVFGIIGLVAVVLIVVLLLITGGPAGHGPGRHAGWGDTPPATVTGDRLTSRGDVGDQTPPRYRA